MANERYQFDPALSAIVQKFGNDSSEYIADRIFPTVPAPARNYSYRKGSKTDAFNANVNDFVGEFSQVHEVKGPASELVPDIINDYGLATVVGWTEENEKVGDVPFDAKAEK